MTHDALQTFIERTRAAWGPLSSDLAATCRTNLAELTLAAPTEPWLAALHRESPSSKELYRDEEHGFVLLAHVEPEGLYRAPHDHGRGWVVYALQRGAIALSTYARIESERGIELVERDASVLRAGEARVYLPGDIHDTRSVAGPALLFRFTAVDLKREDAEGRLTRYVDRDGRWTVRA